MQPHGSWGQKQGPTVPDQKRPTPENPSQTRPIPIRTNRHTPVQSIPQVRDIHVGSYRPHECLVIASSFLINSVYFYYLIILSKDKSHSTVYCLPFFFSFVIKFKIKIDVENSFPFFINSNHTI